VDNIPTQSGVYRYVVRFTAADPRSRALLADAHALGLTRFITWPATTCSLSKAVFCPQTLIAWGRLCYVTALPSSFKWSRWKPYPLSTPET